MKHFLALFFLTFTLQVSQAQSWEPFVYDQLSYYMQVEADGDKKVETFLVDKYGLYNNFYSYIFNANGDMPDNCYTALGNELKGTFFINKDKLEYLQIAGADKFLYRNPGTSNFIEFRPKAEVGASWTTNGLSFTCTGKAYKKVLGIDDSVKVFNCLTAPFDTIEIELSKNYGFTKFLPFNEFFDPTAQDGRSPYFELIGYKYNNIRVGYQQPEFADYFPVNVGDELYWKHYNYMSQVAINDYYYDKITKAYHSLDSVYYEFDRTVIENGIVKANLQGSKYYLKSIYGKVVEGKTSWYGSTGKVVSQLFPPSSSKAFWMWPIYIKEENGDTINTSSFVLLDLVVNPLNCNTIATNEEYFSHNWSTEQGETYYSHETLVFTDRIELVGSIINGKQSGVMPVATAVLSTESDNNFTYPNPVKDKLNLTLNKPAETVQLMDMNGNLLFTIPYNEKIDLSSVNPGVYILRVNYTSQSKFVRIVKQ